MSIPPLRRSQSGGQHGEWRPRVEESFWKQLDALIESTEIVIDRPGGSAHPRYPSFVYPLDYGYLQGTSGGDGQGIDVWRGSAAERRLDAIVCTVDMLKRDLEVKLLIGCTENEQAAICQFHNDGKSMAAILLGREPMRKGSGA
jgi:inorganic pyrophosphatase